MEHRSSPTRKKPRTVTVLLSWLLFGICLVVVLSEILGFQLPVWVYQEPQQITAHHHGGILDLQAIWNEMEILYHAS